MKYYTLNEVKSFGITNETICNYIAKPRNYEILPIGCFSYNNKLYTFGFKVFRGMDDIYGIDDNNRLIISNTIPSNIVIDISCEFKFVRIAISNYADKSILRDNNISFII